MNNAFDLPKEFSEENSSAIVILPIPFEHTTSWLHGTKDGPTAIIEASRYVELYDIETDSEIYRRGIYTAQPLKANAPEEMIQQAYHAVRLFLKEGKFVISLGGEHSVSIGPIKAGAEIYSDLSILHFDAHTDRRESYEGTIYSHACAIAQASEYVTNIVSVGIRSMDISEKGSLTKEKLFLAEKMVGDATEDYINNILKQLSDTVYITFDVDCFDPSIMPATGTPEPGGLGWYQTLQILKAVCKNKKIIGADFVELMPTATNYAPNFLVAKLIYKFLSYRIGAMS